MGNIEHIGRTESDQHGLILVADVFLGFGIFLPPDTNHGGKDANSLLILSSRGVQAGSTHTSRLLSLRTASV